MMGKVRIIFYLGGFALLMVGVINNNAVWVVGLSLIALALITGIKDKEQ